MREHHRKSKEFWDAVAMADAPAGLHGLLNPDPLHAAYRDLAEKSVLIARHGPRIGRGGRLLEIGCGGGRWTVWLASRFDHVDASDISPRMIERARERVVAAGIDNVELACASMEAVPLRGPYDLVYLGGCLQYMTDEAIDEGVARLAAHVRPGTLLLSRDTVSLTGRSFARPELFGDPDDPTVYRTAAWYRDAMRAHGFALVDDWPTYVRPLAWRVRKLLPAALLRWALDKELAFASVEVSLERLLHRTGAKDHRFWLYEFTKPPAHRIRQGLDGVRT